MPRCLTPSNIIHVSSQLDDEDDQNLKSEDSSTTDKIHGGETEFSRLKVTNFPSDLMDISVGGHFCDFKAFDNGVKGANYYHSIEHQREEFIPMPTSPTCETSGLSIDQVGTQLSLVGGSPTTTNLEYIEDSRHPNEFESETIAMKAAVTQTAETPPTTQLQFSATQSQQTEALSLGKRFLPPFKSDFFSDSIQSVKFLVADDDFHSTRSPIQHSWDIHQNSPMTPLKGSCRLSQFIFPKNSSSNCQQLGVFLKDKIFQNDNFSNNYLTSDRCPVKEAAAVSASSDHLSGQNKKCLKSFPLNKLLSTLEQSRISLQNVLNELTTLLTTSDWHENSSEDIIIDLTHKLVFILNVLNPGCLGYNKDQFFKAGAPIILAHPDEFKNPSSFLKIYGDPQCHYKLNFHPKRGQKGNWNCVQCKNVNYPRRFRCHNLNCRALRDAEGDKLVSDYARKVFLNITRQKKKVTVNQPNSYFQIYDDEGDKDNNLFCNDRGSTTTPSFSKQHLSSPDYSSRHNSATEKEHFFSNPLHQSTQFFNPRLF